MHERAAGRRAPAPDARGPLRRWSTCDLRAGRDRCPDPRRAALGPAAGARRDGRRRVHHRALRRRGGGGIERGRHDRPAAPRCRWSSRRESELLSADLVSHAPRRRSTRRPSAPPRSSSPPQRPAGGPGGVRRVHRPAHAGGGRRRGRRPDRGRGPQRDSSIAADSDLRPRPAARRRARCTRCSSRRPGSRRSTGRGSSSSGATSAAVPPDHPESNYGAARQSCCSTHLPRAAPGQVHRMIGEAADLRARRRARYQALIARDFVHHTGRSAACPPSTSSGWGWVPTGTPPRSFPVPTALSETDALGGADLGPGARRLADDAHPPDRQRRPRRCSSS